MCSNFGFSSLFFAISFRTFQFYFELSNFISNFPISYRTFQFHYGLSNFITNFPTSSQTFQLHLDLSNFISIFPTSFKSFQLHFELSNFISIFPIRFLSFKTFFKIHFLGIKPLPGIFMELKKPREEPLSWPYHYSAMPVSAHPHPWIHTVYWSRFRPESPGPVSQRHHA